MDLRPGARLTCIKRGNWENTLNGFKVSGPSFGDEVYVQTIVESPEGNVYVYLKGYRWAYNLKQFRRAEFHFVSMKNDVRKSLQWWRGKLYSPTKKEVCGSL